MSLRTILILCVSASLVSCGSGNDSNSMYEALEPTNPVTVQFLDSHLHSGRSYDFGNHGLNPDISGTPESLRTYADRANVDVIWLTDHPNGYPDGRPTPFQSTEGMVDGVEYCRSELGYSLGCVNLVTLSDGQPYRLLTYAFRNAAGNPLLSTMDGVEGITTGGDPNLESDLHDGQGMLNYMVQHGMQPAVLGSSNSHAGAAGNGGLTAVYFNGGESFTIALRAKQTTAIRTREVIPFLFADGSLTITRKASRNEYRVYLVHVYQDRTEATALSLVAEQAVTFDTSALAAYVIVYGNRRPVAITSPIYF